MHLRPAKVSDAKAIHALIVGYAEQDRMLSRSMADIYENLQTGYGLGQTADFADLIESVKNILDFQLEQAKAARNLHAAAAEIERLMGGPWTNND